MSERKTYQVQIWRKAKDSGGEYSYLVGVEKIKGLTDAKIYKAKLEGEGLEGSITHKGVAIPS